jgi:hypothetical protein
MGLNIKNATKKERFEAYYSKFKTLDEKMLIHFGFDINSEFGYTREFLVSSLCGKIGFKNVLEGATNFLKGEHKIYSGGYELIVNFKDVSFGFRDLPEVDSDVVALKNINVELLDGSNVTLGGEDADLINGPLVDEHGEDVSYFVEYEVKDAVEEYLFKNVEYVYGVYLEPHMSILNLYHDI